MKEPVKRFAGLLLISLLLLKGSFVFLAFAANENDNKFYIELQAEQEKDSSKKGNEKIQETESSEYYPGKAFFCSTELPGFLVRIKYHITGYPAFSIFYPDIPTPPPNRLSFSI